MLCKSVKNESILNFCLDKVKLSDLLNSAYTSIIHKLLSML